VTGLAGAARGLAAGTGYDARSIVILPGLEAVRRNPAMYVGSTTTEGLHHLVFELVDNAVDEAEAGYCHEIEVRLHPDGSCSVRDDGRGIPVDLHPEADRPACEVLMTTLHSGGKFGGPSYTTAAGLHGVGMSCVNALATWLVLEVCRDGGQHRQRFSRGERTTELERVADSADRGTSIRFLPDPTILETVEFSAETLLTRLEEIAFLHPDLRVRFVDERVDRERTELLSFTSGVRGFLEHRHPGTTAVHPEPIVITRYSDELSVELALRWTEGYAEDIRSFVNSVRTVDGGSHVDGVPPLSPRW
jgi:DNA gyrase subunit B